MKWWQSELQRRERVKLQAKINMLEENGGDLPPGLLMKTEVEYIYKLKVQGNPKLRPMICRGPLTSRNEATEVEKDEDAYTILIGAKEISWKYQPAGADTEAGLRRQIVIRNPARRCKHVRIT